MLQRLVITNLAIIENIDISFDKGFTVLTGATGAGKSLIIDSLSLLLGERASLEMIRTGEEKAIIDGYFDINSQRLKALLDSLEIPYEETIKVERIISRNKSVVKINGVTISLGELNRIASFLADIHSQFDFMKILNPENYLDMVDGYAFDVISNYKNKYIREHDAYKKTLKEYQDLLDKKAKIDASRDFYEYQYKELKELDIQKDEEEEIDNKIAMLSNFDKIYALSEEARELIDNGVADSLHSLVKVLNNLSKYQTQYQLSHDKLNDYYFEIVDQCEELIKDFKNIEYDPNVLSELVARKSDIKTAKKKYKKTANELIDYLYELEGLIGSKSNIDEEILDKKNEVDSLFKTTFQAGKDLTNIRKKYASNIEKELMRNLKDLMLQVNFQIAFNSYDEETANLFLENGLDTVDFLIETNVGEGLKSLSKVISGGEASRIMLALKAIFIKANRISTVVFDEIDTGLSGDAAEAVAQKIHEISLSTQVISITHMPQVASLSDNHIMISKIVKNSRTYTNVRSLNFEEKVTEVARLISSGNVTNKQLDYAREMVLRYRL